MLSLLLFGLTVPLGLDTYIPAPENNPLTIDKVQLGRELFRDPKLSRDGRISCASCHDSARAFSDDRPLAIGVDGQIGNRRSPAILNRAFGKSFFWDGRAKTLEEQVLQPIANPKEMDLKTPLVVARLRESAYAARFKATFGREVNEDDLARALASYVRTILAGDSPYDRYVAGDRAALSSEAQQGLKLFRGRAGCVACHVGMNLTDERLHNTGAGKSDWELVFKTPTLREVARRAPYMHDGSLQTLDEVVDFYDKGGKANPRLDPEIHELRLTAAEKRALIEFLKSLSGRVQEGW